ncbi:hypothetical protein N9Z02_00180 [Akkermansiaceae bacterium]|nr:hypothetical protein [Akkermansiaceae bacterium]
MDHTRDNPLKRFSAFWIAFLLVGCFGIACVILRPLTHGEVDTAYEMVSEERLAVKAEIKKAEAASLSSEKLQKALEATAKNLNQPPSKGAMPLPGASQ